jgi:murein DD-endopeptidase MepM/ murein hydrolase activator NlpD
VKKIIREESQNNGGLYHPPLLPMPDIPIPNHHGGYMVKRRFDVHTGIDLFVVEGTPVYSVERGEVVAIRKFTGGEAGTSFWENTMAVDIEGLTGTICYGEVTPVLNLKVGDIVQCGQVIAHVKRVLKEYKGKPRSMLHFAIHRHGWKYLYKDQQDPEMESFYDLLIDPTMLLIQLKNKADLMVLTSSMHNSKGGNNEKVKCSNNGRRNP